MGILINLIRISIIIYPHHPHPHHPHHDHIIIMIIITIIMITITIIITPVPRDGRWDVESCQAYVNFKNNGLFTGYETQSRVICQQVALSLIGQTIVAAGRDNDLVPHIAMTWWCIHNTGQSEGTWSAWGKQETRVVYSSD
jgi:hypothetical protein